MSHCTRIGIIGGTGLDDALSSAFAPTNLQTHEIETPFGSPSVPIVTGEFDGAPLALLARHGAGHVLNPARVPYRANIFALKMLGCSHVVASGATGSLREEIRPGDVVICDQLINKTDGRDKTFYKRAAVHVEFADPFCPVTRRWLLHAAGQTTQTTVHTSGTYVCMEGPAFSTRAESHMHRQWGADLVGMTALPEARLAREAEMGYALIALPTDYDCWRERPESDAPAESLLEEIIGNLKRSTAAAIELMSAAIRDRSILEEQPSPAHDALKLAIWSDRSKIDAAEIERLAPLWGRYFG